MAGWGIVLDPTSEDATNVQLDLNDGTNFRATDPLRLDAPGLDPTRVSTAATEGELRVENRYKNREIGLGFRIYGSTAAGLETQLGNLAQKVEKVNREGGTLKITTPASTTIVFDLIAASYSLPTVGNAYAATNRCFAEVTFEARPFGRGAAVQSSDRTTTTLPYLVWAESAIPGDVPALGKLVIDEDDADSQSWVVWGVESQYYDTADPSTKKLFYEAEDCFATGGAAAATGASGASGGAANKVVSHTGLYPSWVQMLSLKASTVAGAANGSGSYPAHVGTFRVFARVQMPVANTGEVSIRLEWATGDLLHFTENEPVEFVADHSNEAKWLILDLGEVRLDRVPQGTQAWDGRIAARSSVSGDDLQVDYVLLVPIAEGSGQVFAVTAASSTSVAESARDSFEGAAGAITARVPDLTPGGNWTGAGDADDFVGAAWPEDASNESAFRQATGDSSVTNGRYIRLGTSTPTNTRVQVDYYAGTKAGITTADERRCGVFARYASTTAWLFAGVRISKDSKGKFIKAVVIKNVAGTTTTIAEGDKHYGVIDGRITADLIVDSLGNVVCDVRGQPLLGNDVLTVDADTDLATGGALQNGGYGIYDAWTGSSAALRYYNDFVAFHSVPSLDAAIFASQSLEVRHDRVIREDSSGVYWNPAAFYEGDYLLVPAGGKESRQARFIVKASRGKPNTEADSAIDDISARLTYTPRYLEIPR